MPSIKTNALERKITGISKIGGSSEQAEWALRIYQECGNDLMAVFTAEAESGFIADRVSPKNKNGSRDKGIFQLNTSYHTPFISSPAFKDPYQQITYGCSLWKQYKKKGILQNRWYGYRNIVNDKIALQHVSSRFLISYK